MILVTKAVLLAYLSQNLLENEAFSDAEEIWESSDEEAESGMATEENVRNMQNVMYRFFTVECQHFPQN